MDPSGKVQKLWADEISPIIRPQNKSQENFLIFDVPHMEFFLNLKTKMFQLEGNEWVNWK